MGSSKVTGCARCYSVFLIRSSGQPENVIPRGSRRATNVNCGRSFPESPMVGPLLQRERLFCGVLTGYDRSGTSRMWKATREHFLPSQFYVEPFTCVKILLRDCSFRPSAAKTKRWRQTMVVLAEIRHDYEFSWDCKAETPFSDSGIGNFMIRVNRNTGSYCRDDDRNVENLRLVSRHTSSNQHSTDWSCDCGKRDRCFANLFSSHFLSNKHHQDFQFYSFTSPVTAVIRKQIRWFPSFKEHHEDHHLITDHNQSKDSSFIHLVNNKPILLSPTFARWHFMFKIRKLRSNRLSAKRKSLRLGRPCNLLSGIVADCGTKLETCSVTIPLFRSIRYKALLKNVLLKSSMIRS